MIQIIYRYYYNLGLEHLISWDASIKDLKKRCCYNVYEIWKGISS